MNEESIKVLSLLDELEELLTSSNKVPFSDKCVVDMDTAQSIIDDIRMNLPQDLQQARWICQQKDDILNDAKTNYNKVIMSATDQAESLIENSAIKREAEKRAAVTKAEAENHAGHLKMRTYEYIDKLLYDMQSDISSIANSYLQPMNDFIAETIDNINQQVNRNRQEMQILAQRVQVSSTNPETLTQPDPAENPETPEF